MRSELSVDDVKIDIVATGSRTPRHNERHTIKTFRHCSKFVFCFEFPDFCPICNGDLLASELRVPPFVYQSPFDSQSSTQLVILVKPSKDRSFLHDYNNGDYLHCGIQDEDGFIHDFDERGIHQSSQQWLNCVNIPIDASSGQSPLKDSISKAKHNWAKKHERYDSDSANCFTFVLFCLKASGYYIDISEDDFIAEVVILRTTEASRYISVYRSLVSAGGIYVSNDTSV